MGKSRRKTIIHEKLLITDIASEGKAIARLDDLVVFVTNCIPGDVVDVRIQKKQKNFQEGIPTRFHQLSPLRTEAFCSHFGTCGGCKWQSLPYTKQLEFKQKQVADQFSRIGHLQFPEIEQILPSEKTIHYRNKLEFTFSNLRWLTAEEINLDEPYGREALGFHVPRMFDRIVDIDTCYLQKEPSNELRLFIKKRALELNIAFYNQRTHEGEIRNLIVRTTTTNQLMLIVVFAAIDDTKREALLSSIHTNYPDITSLNFVINTKRNDSIHDLDVVNYAGMPYILEQMEERKFRIGPKSFYQTNSEQAYELYKKVRDFAGLTGQEVLFDLYAGTGTIGLFLADRAKVVVGIEYVPEAIEDAKINAELNQIEHAHFYAGDIKDLLTPIMTQHGKPDVVVVDPPRAGLHKDVAETLLTTDAKTLVYVSCNPATQARDLEILCRNYQIEKVQPVDMFPHTHHVENIVLLKKMDTFEKP